jgi:hypothetical protein
LRKNPAHFSDASALHASVRRCIKEETRANGEPVLRLLKDQRKPTKVLATRVDSDAWQPTSHESVFNVVTDHLITWQRGPAPAQGEAFEKLATYLKTFAKGGYWVPEELPPESNDRDNNKRSGHGSGRGRPSGTGHFSDRADAHKRVYNAYVRVGKELDWFREPFKKEVADELGMPRTTLLYHLDRWGISWPPTPPNGRVT